MWGMASQLSDPMISELANYFATQPAAEGKPGNAALIAQGKHLIEEGVPARQIPPCAGCHGAHAQGMATFPRLSSPGDARGGCVLFPGKSVPAAGWCKVWRKIF
jgi:cytochrome c553